MTILLSSCQLCRRVQDEDDAVWLDLDDYLFRHDAGRAEVIFAHTYCEDCATSSPIDDLRVAGCRLICAASLAARIERRPAPWGPPPSYLKPFRRPNCRPSWSWKATSGPGCCSPSNWLSWGSSRSASQAACRVCRRLFRRAAADRWPGLLLGLQVPALDGMAILQELQVRRLNIPVIMMSGADDIGFLREAVTAGARDYLVTPIDKELFKRKCLRTFLGQSPFA